MNLFSKLFRSRDKPRNHLGGLSFLFGQTAAGKAVNERTALQTTAIYACVRILAESIARLSIHVYAYKGQGKERVPEHPLYFLLHNAPNPEMTSLIFRETMMSHLFCGGIPTHKFCGMAEARFSETLCVSVFCVRTILSAFIPTFIDIS